MQKTKSAITLLSTILLISMVITICPTSADNLIAAGTHIPTFAYLNVFPNPAGIGQTVTLNIFLATPYPTGEVATPFYVNVVNPSGSNTTLGPYTSDTTEGTVAYFTPQAVGNYTIQFYFTGQALTNTSTVKGVYADPSQSLPVTLVVQEEANIQRGLEFTPLPTQWWQTPVSAENSQNWYQVTGAWYGFTGASSFTTTGSYNNTGNYNPYTEDVLAGHVLWTKQWCGGGVAGGELGGDEIRAHYWSTYQYQPRYAPVMINGVLYSTWYTSTKSGTAGLQGIVAIDLYTGETLWLLNTTSALRCGMVTYQYTINEYGVLGPFLWTTGALGAGETGGSKPNSTGTQWNLFDAVTGKYVLSLVNGSDIRIRNDEDGNLIGYFINSTSGSQIVHPTQSTNAIANNTGAHLTCVNLTLASGFTSSQFAPSVNTVRAFSSGYMWDVPVPTTINNVPIDPELGLVAITGNEVVLTAGNPSTGQKGYTCIVTMDQSTGAVVGSANMTYPNVNAMLPYSRTGTTAGNGIYGIANNINGYFVGYYTKDCTKAWEVQLTGDNGATPNTYDVFGYKIYTAKDSFIICGLGGDIWSVDSTAGTVNWYTNTTKLQGSSGIETPYNVWPVWAFASGCISNNVAYITGGHEYNPPLFHGCQLYGVNVTDGSLIWSELDTSVTSTAIAYSKLVSLNAYDNQLYCFGKGPSGTTVEAPTVGVTTSTPITITGTVMDFSAGTTSTLVSSKYPYGLPCVSDQSQSDFMESVYQQQVMPNNITGVDVTLSVIDSNNNFRDIGTTHSDASGTFAYTWTPDISGSYTVIATFAGSNSYYGSSGEAHFYAGETPTQQPTATAISNVATTSDVLTYMSAGVIAIIIAIAVVGLLLMRKK
jgi:hypothetical protein